MTMKRRLTDYAACGGCASKLAAGALHHVLGALPLTVDDRVLIDYRTADDAGVYALDETNALVQTVDFFTPIVDDPYVYGQIAAANAVSDVYAMGGTPLTALAVAAFPAKDFDPGDIAAVFRGGLDKLGEAGVALLGGHTVQDSEVKFGYAVTGIVRRDRMLSNAGARPGDVLLLTKPLGTGAITTAIKFGRAPESAATAAIRSMCTLNRQAAEIVGVRPVGEVHACTDVTGFSLIGHASGMAAASGVTLAIGVSSVPLIAGALDLAPQNRPGGSVTNAAHFGPGVHIEGTPDEQLVALLYDPQTSGGLLLAVDAAAADGVEADLRSGGVPVQRIGDARPAGPWRVVVY